MTTLNAPAEVTGWAVELNGRGAYVAQLTGTHPKYGLAREWCDRRKSWQGKRGWFGVVTEPGWYEVKTTPYASTGPVRYYASFDGNHWERIPRTFYEFVPLAVDGPQPDKPGAWFGDRCHCGEPVDRYTPAGFPRCADHFDPDEHREHSRRGEPAPDTGPDYAPF